MTVIDNLRDLYRWYIFILIHIIMPLTIISVVYFRFTKILGSSHYIIMQISAVSIIIEIVLSSIARDYGYDYYQNESYKQFSYIDKFFGILMILQVSLGQKIKSSIFRKNADTSKYGASVLTHRAFGYGMMVFFLIREGKIVRTISSLKVIIRIVTYLGFLVAYLALYFRKWGKGIFGVKESKDEQWLIDIHPTDKKANCEFFTSKDIFTAIQGGSYIFLYNNYVIDASPFVSKHPGSFELMSRKIGTNISLVIEGHTRVNDMIHQHSKTGLKKLNSLIVGKMVEDFAIQVPKKEDVGKPYELQTFTIVDREKIGKNVFRITFKSDKYYYFVSSRDNRLGLHFNVQNIFLKFLLNFDIRLISN